MIKNDTLILIGMPGSGKTTLGKRLAKTLNKAFIDTDALIEKQQQSSLQDLVDQHGYQALRDFEAQAVSSVTASNAVIATGGSVIYNPSSIDYLRSLGFLVYLSIGFDTMKVRIGDFSHRGLAKPDNQDLAALYQERHSLYQLAADRVVDCDGLEIDQAVEQVLDAVNLSA